MKNKIKTKTEMRITINLRRSAIAFLITPRGLEAP